VLTALRTDADPQPVVDEAPLVRQARAGDHDAFRVLYERYAPALLGLLASRLGDRDGAEDALQETFAKAYRALGVFDDARPFGPWIAAIAENVAIDHLRRRGRTARPAEIRDDALVTPAEQVQVASRREGEEIVRAALAGLPPEARAVLLLRYQRGLTQRDAADALGVSLRTVQTREGEALARLAVLLEARRTKARGAGS
jgi:RNA polymerase sigma-70 factor (ECF subfamily)